MSLFYLNRVEMNLTICKYKCKRKCLFHSTTRGLIDFKLVGTQRSGIRSINELVVTVA